MKFDGIAGQIITEVGISLGFDPAKPPPDVPPVHMTSALWDTGATRSVVSTSIVSDLALGPVGVTKVNHAGGTSMSPLYLVNFMLPNRVGIVGIMVTEFPSIIGGFGAIIGMDIISSGDFALTHADGKSCMSFRIPSCGPPIDYVVEANNRLKASLSNVGRNDPCPCGKLREDGVTVVKFKTCHGR